MKNYINLIFLLIFLILLFGCSDNNNIVVVYTALDRRFSEPILKKFEQETGIKVKVKYDTESTKTVGLTACLLEERTHPRCDVFWNNEIVNTIRLKQAKVLTPYFSPKAKNIPEQFKDTQGYWTGFAARARVLIINKNLVKKNNYPTSIFDLTKPKWKGKFGMAKPIAGTTATHVVSLFNELGNNKTKIFLNNLKLNKVSLESGNKTCAQKVANGELHIALTDTDDAIIEIDQNKPVSIVYLDKNHDELGTLFIPNTLALIANSPNSQNGKKLIDYLLTAKVEKILAAGPSAQIPLNKKLKLKLRVKTPKNIKSMKVNFETAAKKWNKVQKYILTTFLNGN